MNKNIIELINYYESRIIPKMPIGADILMTKYKMSEGKQLGNKLKEIEGEWVKNNFKISVEQVENIINN